LLQEAVAASCSTGISLFSLFFESTRVNSSFSLVISLYLFFCRRLVGRF
jgi:hypothetical protein